MSGRCRLQGATPQQLTKCPNVTGQACGVEQTEETQRSSSYEKANKSIQVRRPDEAPATLVKVTETKVLGRIPGPLHQPLAEQVSATPLPGWAPEEPYPSRGSGFDNACSNLHVRATLT